MHIHLGANRRPIIQRIRFANTHINTAVTHRRAKITVPIGAMDGVIRKEIHYPRDVRQIVTGAIHPLASNFAVDIKTTSYGRCGLDPRTDTRIHHRNIALPGDQRLRAEIDFDPTFSIRRGDRITLDLRRTGYLPRH